MNGHAKQEKHEDKEEEDVKMEEEEEEKEKERSPLIELLDSRFLLTLPDSLVPALERQVHRNKVQDLVTKHKMAALYPSLCNELKWPIDQTFADKLKADAIAEKERLEARIAKAKEEAGDMEVRDALFALAEFLALSGERDAAYAAYKDALAQSVGIGSRMDVLFCCMRVALLHNDLHGVKQYIEQAKALIATGADWERRNLLKIYEAVYTIQTRDFKKAAALLLDSIATFTCYEMFSYNTFIFYAVITSIFAVSRTKLKEKVISSPEILSVYRDIPHLETLLQSFYKCRYSQFFAALNALTPTLQRDPFLAPHLTHILREIRVVTYQQYLQSYRSVKLESMAESMGFSTALLDQELSRFISAGRLNCKIDKVKGVVETNRPDTKNHQYQEIIKHGDILLNRLQKLTKSVSG